MLPKGALFPTWILLFKFVAPGQCPTSDFQDGWDYFIQDIDDDFNWLRQRGRTSSSTTGPSADCSTGTTGRIHFH